VSLRTDAYYKTIASSALRQSGIVEPPVAIESVAGRFGIPVKLVHMPAFFSGAMVYEDGMPTIVLNSVLDDNAKRRYLAHLLSHVLLVLEDPETGYPRNQEFVHKEADIVADELLLPADMVAEQAGKWFNDYRYLARLFGVTEHEMLVKMGRLGLMRARSVVWDY
jgi:Zn-dependent peptidase ImmA (M78 family)